MVIASPAAATKTVIMDEIRQKLPAITLRLDATQVGSPSRAALILKLGHSIPGPPTVQRVSVGSLHSYWRKRSDQTPDAPSCSGNVRGTTVRVATRAAWTLEVAQPFAMPELGSPLRRRENALRERRHPAARRETDAEYHQYGWRARG